MANDNLSNLPWEDPDYRAELDRSLMAYGAYLSRTELAVASTSRSLGEFDMPQDWYLLKDENSILDATGESGAFAVEFVNENNTKSVIRQEERRVGKKCVKTCRSRW